MSASTLDSRHPLATKQGWSAFIARANPEPPQLLSDADWRKLDELEREVYDDARQDYHSSLLLVATPDIRKIIHTGSKLIINNRGKQLGRRGLIVSGSSGTGKSTSITQLGKKFQVEFERRNPGIPDRIPVVYIVVPPDANPKALAHTVAAVMRRASTGLVLVDEIHRLDLTTRKGKDASDQLKYFFDTISATFVYAGLDLAETSLFTGVRSRQIAGRFIPVSTEPFAHHTVEAKRDWIKLVATMEHSLRLHHHPPGTLIELAPHLHARTGGMIGSLDQLIYEAANDAISDGSEKITRTHLDAVILDIAANDQYEPPRRPKR
ncbi:ATP-binding protein [Nocardia sp. NPDC005366]|uniref:ATP-binding protein n=1 Tax=Nocardia sp. NPDC005366 TaxID=3156878 RepID=UPI00339E383D